MKIHFLKPAQFELEDAVAWYDSHSIGLGTQFLDNLDRSVRRIVTYPFSSPEIEHGFRRCLLSRFPYGIIYGVDIDTIVIVAIAHLHREPRYWADKLVNER